MYSPRASFRPKSVDNMNCWAKDELGSSTSSVSMNQLKKTGLAEVAKRETTCHRLATTSVVTPASVVSPAAQKNVRQTSVPYRVCGTRPAGNGPPILDTIRAFSPVSTQPRSPPTMSFTSKLQANREEPEKKDSRGTSFEDALAAKIATAMEKQLSLSPSATEKWRDGSSALAKKGGVGASVEVKSLVQQPGSSVDVKSLVQQPSTEAKGMAQQLGPMPCSEELTDKIIAAMEQTRADCMAHCANIGDQLVQNMVVLRKELTQEIGVVKREVDAVKEIQIGWLPGLHGTETGGTGSQVNVLEDLTSTISERVLERAKNELATLVSHTQTEQLQKAMKSASDLLERFSAEERMADPIHAASIKASLKDMARFSLSLAQEVKRDRQQRNRDYSETFNRLGELETRLGTVSVSALPTPRDGGSQADTRSVASQADYFPDDADCPTPRGLFQMSGEGHDSGSLSDIFIDEFEKFKADLASTQHHIADAQRIEGIASKAEESQKFQR